MGISGAPDIFPEKMNNQMCTLEYVRTYIDDLLIIIIGTDDNHLHKIEAVLNCLQLAKLRVTVKKPSFALYEIEYLGCVLTRDGINSNPAIGIYMRHILRIVK